MSSSSSSDEFHSAEEEIAPASASSTPARDTGKEEVDLPSAQAAVTATAGTAAAGTADGGKGPGSMYDAQALQKTVAQQTVFSRMVVFTADAILAASYTVSNDEAPYLASVFDDRTASVRDGYDIDGMHFDVHRFYDNLVYGRFGYDEASVAFGVVRFPREAYADFIYVAVTFDSPMTTARGLPLLHRFVSQSILPLLGM
ncbi:uncharacterized protein AMSG_03597 [Thecamonas trahens ATCC 50062]|uniref:Uncharacterized protein n=1 Tax=Thecamonas trahens ATCC 50062 TaxID=461836 RepID=A0A0L0D4D3_THETB|nr:hypothetical protein AMSG_03597 [Thecamonas trahens ATCC 50062]KNC47169.1 hypothetical protein AMSG_03597 [Thecamonas trahens ATCC 50062]|eukprot:XP_013759943.1 hypothetical protein AMSG_03597 [Thecamonas trahens ATCC 50062]